ncbi:hypothetical protein [Nocardia brasiliensis]|uniref:hypothetical protein n=1 Tax=Nocardia brasiliensis TaxID=37326 RepID=UPI0024554C58|nr:hypothetical protein [Nocardia brasiliensis]
MPVINRAADSLQNIDRVLITVAIEGAIRSIFESRASHGGHGSASETSYSS